MNKQIRTGCHGGIPWQKKSHSSSGFLRSRLFQLIVFVFLGVIGSQAANAQTTNDQSAVLQKCVDLSGLQQYLPINADNSYKPLVVLLNAVPFDTTSVSVQNGKVLQYKTIEEVKSSGTQAYFEFHTVAMAQNTAAVEFIFYHDLNASSHNRFMVTLQLQKANGDWNITQSNIVSQ